MIKSISKLIDINADWNNGTLTDVVAVNDSLELANNYALSFDGVDDRVDLPSSFSSTNKSYTFQFDFNFQGEGYFYDQDDRFIIGFELNTPTIGIYDGAWHDFGVIPTNISSNYAITIATDNTAKLYIDGELKSSITINTVKNLEGTRGIANLNGILENVAIYEVVLTQTEIQNNMNTTLNGTETGLVWASNIDTGSGTELIDIVNGNNGTIYGATWEIDTNRYLPTGNRLSPTIGLSPIGSVESSAISWESLEGLITNGIDQYVDLGTPTELQLSDNHAFTWEGWVYFRSFDSRDMLVSKNDGRDASPYDYLLGSTDNNTKLGAYDGSVWKSISYILPQNEFVHLGFSYDGTDMHFIVNGEEVGSISFTWALTTSHNIKIGGYVTSCDIDGVYYNVRMWDYGRTPQQVNDNKNKVLDNSETGLLAQYKLNKGSGIVANDSIGTNDGSIINGASWLTTLIETSVDGGLTWQTATNGSSILNLTDIDTTLDVRQTLSTTDTTITPRLIDLYWEVISSDTDISNLNSRITTVRNSPIFKEGIDSIIKVTFLPAKWWKAIEIINQWQTKAKPANNWQSEAKPSNVWKE